MFPDILYNVFVDMYKIAVFYFYFFHIQLFSFLVHPMQTRLPKKFPP